MFSIVFIVKGMGTQKNCRFKVNGDTPSCANCAGDHKTKDCTQDCKKCINCVKHSKSDTNTVNSRECKSLEEEL